MDTFMMMQIKVVTLTSQVLLIQILSISDQSCWPAETCEVLHLPLYFGSNLLRGWGDVGVGVQGEPSDSASLRGARAADARALVFLGAAQRPMMVRRPPPPPPPHLPNHHPPLHHYYGCNNACWLMMSQILNAASAPM